LKNYQKRQILNQKYHSMKLLKLLIIIVIKISFNELHALKAQNNINQSKIETIIKLTKFIDWSQNLNFSNSKRILIVLTDKKLVLNYELQSANEVNLKNWEIKYADNINDIEKGSVVYITKNQKDKVQKIIMLSKKLDILTISDNIPDFCKNGGMINLFDQENDIKFEINYQIIQNKSLEINSKVLALAKIYD